MIGHLLDAIHNQIVFPAGMDLLRTDRITCEGMHDGILEIYESFKEVITWNAYVILMGKDVSQVSGSLEKIIVFIFADQRILSLIIDFIQGSGKGNMSITIDFGNGNDMVFQFLEVFQKLNVFFL